MATNLQTGPVVNSHMKSNRQASSVRLNVCGVFSANALLVQSAFRLSESTSRELCLSVLRTLNVDG